MQKKPKYLIFSFGLFVLALFLLPKIYTLCTDERASGDIISAIIYDNSQYSLGGEGLKLTSEGIDLTGWQYTDSKYLQINVSIPQDGKKYAVKVSTAKEIYLVTNELVVPAGFSDVTFTKNEDILVNTNASYKVNDYSGTAFYKVADGISTATIQLELKYDYYLWNKQGNAILNNSDEKALTVEFEEINDDNENAVTSLLLNNATSGEGVGLTHSIAMTVNGVNSTTDTLEMVYKKDNPDVLKFYSNFYLSNQSTTSLYFKKLRIKINLPYYTKDDQKYYLSINKNSLSFTRMIGGKIKYDIDDSDEANGLLIINLYDFYITSGQFLGYQVDFPNEIDPTSDSKFSFIGGKSVMYMIDNDDNEVYIYAASIKAINYNSSYSEEVLLKTTGNYSVPYSNTSDTLVNTLGGFYLYNRGTGDSNQKHIDMLFDNYDTGYIKITTINLPTDRTQTNLNINYRLVDDDNKLVCKDSDGNYVSDNGVCADYWFNITVKNPNYSTNASISWNGIKLLFHRGLLPSEEQKYYFKEVSLDIDKIKAGQLLYSYASEKSYAGTGNYYGIINYHDIKNKSVYSKISVTSEGFDTIEKETATVLNNYSSTPYNVSNVSVNNLSKQNVSVTAGNSIMLKGQVDSITYPYGSVPWMNNIVIGLLLPNGISVNDESVILKTKNNSNIKPSKVEMEDLYNGQRMWKIYVPSDISIGYASETLGPGVNGNYIQFELQLNTEYYMNQQTITLSNAVFTASVRTETDEASVNAAGGSFNWASKTDVYDLNSNGSTTDKIGGLNQIDTTSFEIVPQSASFDISDNISINNASESNIGHLYQRDDVINYKLSLNCTHGGMAKDFSYYIPIPKSTSGTDSYMISSLDDIFDLNLQTGVNILGDDLYDIYYTTDEGLNINNVGDEGVTWLTSESVTDYSKVTMIKLLQKNETIESGSTTTISLNLMYGNEYFEKWAGKSFTYHSAGNYTYSLNGRETSGLFATNGVSLDINYVVTLPDVTLTAAPDRNPLIAGNIVTYETQELDLPDFAKAQNLVISNVVTYNVTLNTKEYINNNLDMEGIYANETFAITASLNEGLEKDILSNASDISVSLGASVSGVSPRLKYTIYNANNILDNSKTRYIIVTFTSDKGVTIKQKIIINREESKANNPVSSIVSGNRYQTFDDTTSNVAISKNASFTSQFVFDFIPDMYTNKYIVFDTALPIGTTLTMYDYINDETPTYWYYIVTSETKKIELTDFKKMGSQNTYYTYLTGSIKYKEIYLLNVDFIETEDYETTNNSVHLEMLGKEVDNVVSVDLTFNTYDKRTFNITMADSISMREYFTINMNMASSVGTESNYMGKKMAYVISASDLPVDTYVLVNDTKYYMNATNKFIIPLDDVLDGDKAITLSFNTLTSSLKDTYALTLELMVSQNSVNDSPLMGEVVASKIVTLNYPIKKTPSFKVNGLSERVISKESLKDDKTIYLDFMDDGDSLVYVELQKKVLNSYQKVTDKLNRIAGVTKHDMGVFKIDITNKDSSITFKLANTTEIGTYRLVFIIKDSDNNTYYEIPYAFVIAD